jgi:dolichyl-diphosphooligosaccharide--protein glycosyltransferase
MNILDYNLNKIFRTSIVATALILIAWIAVWVRLGTINTPTVLDYDPWWFYRYAQMIVDNGLKLPSWDIQSFSQPGRPLDPFNGWPYTIVFFYRLMSAVHSISLMRAAILSPLIMAALITIPSFLLGRLLTNNLGGLVTALFAVLTPSFIGVSMAGYCDSDAPVVFCYFLSMFATLLALKQPKPAYAIFAIVANLFFVWNWGGGWITLILFTVFLFALPFFRILESFIHTFKFKFDLKELLKEMVAVGQPIFLIILITNILSLSLFNFTQFSSFFGGLAFTGLASAVRWFVLLILLVWASIFTYYFFRRSTSSPGRKQRTYYLICLFGSGLMFYLIIAGFLTSPTTPLLVNISVAELQPVNILSMEGFISVASRVGFLPTLLAFGIFALALNKMLKKEKIAIEEIFFFIWLLSMFILISRGVRFGLQFSIAAAVASGYMISNYKKYPLLVLLIMLFSLVILQRLYLTSLYDILGTVLIIIISAVVLYKKEYGLTELLILGIFAFQLLFFVSDAIKIGQSGGMEIGQNWYNALDWLVENSDKDTIVATWWDPGHILAGYSYYKGKPFKVMADGAHCGPEDCVIYDHDIRITDMGRAFSTADEVEAVEILKKYTSLSPEQCQKVKSIFGKNIYDNIFKDNPCKPVSKMYVIASADLIGKYYWLSYFGSGGNGRNFIQLPMSSYDPTQGTIQYGNGLITIAQKNNQLVPIINIPQQGIRNAIIKNIIFYQDGQQINQSFENVTNVVDGLLWVEPGFRTVIFMDPQIQNSIFTRMFFFNGQGLNHFQLVYSNPEIRVFKVKF